MQTHYDRTTLTEVQRFAPFCEVVVSDKRKLNGALTEEKFVLAANSQVPSASAHHAVRLDACEDDALQILVKAWSKRTGHVLAKACIWIWRALRDIEIFSSTLADANAVVERLLRIGGQQDFNGCHNGMNCDRKCSRTECLIASLWSLHAFHVTATRSQPISRRG